VNATAEVPAPLKWAARLLVAEAVAVVVTVAGLAFQWLREAPADPLGTVGVILYAAIMAAALAGVGLALLRRKPRARAPAVVLQLVGVVVAYYLVMEGLLVLSLAVAALALLVITLLMLPSTTEALTS
jgi:hypothetical protein